MPQDVTQALADLSTERTQRVGVVVDALDRRFLGADTPDEQRRGYEARRVGGDGRGRADPLDEQTCETGPRGGGHRAADLELGVTVGELVAFDQGRQDRLVRHVEEDRE